jgi:Domain of unknown function (DUF3459)
MGRCRRGSSESFKSSKCRRTTGTRRPKVSLSGSRRLNARPCGGTTAITAGSPQGAHGCRWATTLQRNVLRLQQDPHSIIWLYRRLIELRRSEPALTAGSYEPMRSSNDVLMYKRSNADKQLLIALNFGPNPRRLSFDGQAHLLISTHLDRDHAPLSSATILRGDEGIVLRLCASHG